MPNRTAVLRNALGLLASVCVATLAQMAQAQNQVSSPPAGSLSPCLARRGA